MPSSLCVNYGTAMNKCVCIDANIFIASFCNEPGQELAKELFSQLLEQHYKILVPAIINFELANVLARKEKNGLLTERDSKHALRQFATFPILLLWQTEYLDQAMDLQRKNLATVFDASYLATAKANKIPLITEDQDLIKRGKKIHPAIYTTAQWLQLNQD